MYESIALKSRIGNLNIEVLKGSHNLELPNEKQVKEFIRHLWDVHSWCKHIPLLSGTKFIVFLSSDSGSNYPLEHPKLKYGNNLKGYRRQFGYLDYAYSCNRLNFYSDGGRMLNEKEVNRIPNKVNFVLYPYVHSEIYWSFHEEALKKLANGFVHPHSFYLIELYDLERKCDVLSKDIPEVELDYCLDIIDGDLEHVPNKVISEKPHMYIENKKRINSIWLNLQSIERNKVTMCVGKFIDELRNS